jgi:uncharacterized membrane protein
VRGRRTGDKQENVTEREAYKRHLPPSTPISPPGPFVFSHLELVVVKAAALLVRACRHVVAVVGCGALVVLEANEPASILRILNFLPYACQPH